MTLELHVWAQFYLSLATSQMKTPENPDIFLHISGLNSVMEHLLPLNLPAGYLPGKRINWH